MENIFGVKCVWKLGLNSTPRKNEIISTRIQQQFNANINFVSL